MHQLQIPDEPPAAEAEPWHVAHVALGLPVTIKLVGNGRQLARTIDAIELEARVPLVHVEVHPVVAPRRQHHASEVRVVDLRPVEVRDEALVREAEAATHRVRLVLPVMWHAAPPVAPVRVELPIGDQWRQVLAEGDEPRRDTDVVRPGAEAGRAVVEPRDRRGVRLRGHEQRAVGHHAVVAVSGLEGAVEGADETRHHFGLSRDGPGARLSRRALRLLGAGDRVELDLSRVPFDDHDARVGARAVGAQVGGDERRGHRDRRPDERILVEPKPAPFVLERRSHDCGDGRRREAGVRVRHHGGAGRDAKVLDVALLGVRGLHGEGGAVQTIEEAVSDGLRQLHALVAEPRQIARPVDGPRQEVAGSRDSVLVFAEISLALDGRARAPRDRNAVLVGDDDEPTRLERERHLARRGVQLEGATADARRLPGLLQVGERALQAFHSVPVVTAARGLAREVRHLDAVSSLGVADGPGGVGAEHAEVVLAHRRGARHVVDVVDTEQRPLG